VAEVALAHALLAAFLTALRTGNGICRKLAATGTFVEAVETVGMTAGVTLVEAGTNLPPTFTTGNQAVGTEALARGGTDAKLRAVLLATWATNGTISTNERMRAVGACNGLGTQMAATLARATLRTFCLAGETNAVITDGAARDMFCTGSLTTGPANLPALLTVGLTTIWTIDHATLGADYFATGITLADALIATDVAIAIQGDGDGFPLAGVTGGSLDIACVAVTCDMGRGLAFAVAKLDLRHGYGDVDNGIGVEVDLDAQPVVFDFFGNFAIQIGFQGTSLLAGGVV
jgi:hypothetical protein